MERLQKVISNLGYTSRRDAEKLILDGKVLVNGHVAKIGDKVTSSDEININGLVLDKTKSLDKVYYLLNKPRGVLTTSKDDLGRKTVIDLINTDKRIYPIGRLDYDTTGVLLLTNDGNLTNKLIHPRNNIEKVYLAKIKGIVTGTDINKLKAGIMIDGKKTYPARVKLKSYDKKARTSMVEVIIHEGRNHQVKKMFEALNYECLKLTRLRFAFLDVKSLASGEYRMLAPKEIKRLYSLIKDDENI